MKFSIKDFFSKCDQIRSFLRIWKHLLKKFWMENFIFRAVENSSCWLDYIVLYGILATSLPEIHWYYNNLNSGCLESSHGNNISDLAEENMRYSVTLCN